MDAMVASMSSDANPAATQQASRFPARMAASALTISSSDDGKLHPRWIESPRHPSLDGVFYRSFMDTSPDDLGDATLSSTHCVTYNRILSGRANDWRGCKYYWRLRIVDQEKTIWL